MKNICECESRSDNNTTQIRSGSECCKLKINETNNSVTLESHKLIVIKEISFQTVHYFLTIASNYNLTGNTLFYSKHCIPPSDIPVLISSLLI
ncbi:MAG: hypothetical protein ABI462_08665 [Ignavibacteria bacterium]